MPSLKQVEGQGEVPALTSLISAATKQLMEKPHQKLHNHSRIGKRLEFSTEGMQAADVAAFFDEALKASVGDEPKTESGNRYGVSDIHTDFHTLNGELLKEEVRHAEQYLCLSKEDQVRADEMCDVVFLNEAVRNRNPLHPAVLDSCVIGNLLNFPKAMFGFPLACYGSDGNESLSLVLYSYRQVNF